MKISICSISKAAHCLDTDVKNIKVYVQALHKSSSSSRGIHVSSPQYKIHEDYVINGFDHDIALIYIPELNNVLKDIPILKLPLKNEFFDNLEDKEITVMGYGNTHDNATIASELRYVNSTVGKHSECIFWYGSHYKSEKHVCMHTCNTGSACKGDSGNFWDFFKEDLIFR